VAEAAPRRIRQWYRSSQKGCGARIRQDSPDGKQGVEIIKKIILIVPGFIANFGEKSILDSGQSSVVGGRWSVVGGRNHSSRSVH
jgi:hypothetical protein